ncbi:MAG: formimidoylglutamate deiminase [Xanthomonadales bacterium]|nr:formimidoylglutamate deiminase [Xanthomonadales bacterium]
MARYFFDHALLPDGWADNVLITVAPGGAIEEVFAMSDAGKNDENAIDGRFAVALPGLVNAHSHAFQRAMAGLAEFRGTARDTFWSWRETMYRFALALTPEDQFAISAWLHVELLKHGYTSLVEFHYLHNQPDGRPYDDPSLMSQATVEAAAETGIGLTHLPVLYMTADLSGTPLTDRQRRFGLDVDTLARITERVRDAVRDEPDMTTGLAAHSLRAVPPAAMTALLDARRTLGVAPFHIHVAEQKQEVEDCRTHLGRPPVDWLLDNAPVDGNWTLVHGTHVSDRACAQLAGTGAAVALCPTTEGNLGDGIFPLLTFVNAGGAIAIGSDSHVSVSPWEELRWMEYVQRLHRQERNVMATSANPHTGTALVQHLSRSAAQVTGRPVGRLAAGNRADLVVLDTAPGQFAGRRAEQVLDTAIFAAHGNPVRHVMVGGKWRVTDGHHVQETPIGDRYRKTQRNLAARLAS